MSRQQFKRSEQPVRETASRESAGVPEPDSKIGDFRLIRPIRLSSDSTTYSARDGAGHLVALQKIAAGDDCKSLMAKLESEAQRYDSACPRHLPRIHSISEANGFVLMAMDFVDGASLQWHLGQQKKFTVATAVRIMLAVADAVQSLHEVGLLHRAIRPSTIMLTPHGRAKLEIPRFAALASKSSDWGGEPADLKAAEYMAPEQIERPLSANERSDVYSLGATFYQLVTGTAPFAAIGIADILEKKLSRKFEDPATLVPGLDRETVELIRSSIDPDPARRPSSVSVFCERLRGKLEQIGGCTLLEEIGHGTSSVLFRAVDRDGRIVALKTLRPKAAQDSNRVMRFYQEAKLAMQIDHPHVVRVLQVGEDLGRHFIIMDYVEGENLARWTMRRGRVDEATALKIVGQITEAISYLHAQGIVHRDVNPANILIDSVGHAVLGDLGLSKQRGFDLGLTLDGAGLGTAVFAAPELIFDAKNAQASCDVYGLGATLYSMVTGRRPFNAKSLRRLVMVKDKSAYPDPQNTCPSLTWQTALLIKKAMRSRATRRPTVGDFAKYVRICEQACRMASRPRVTQRKVVPKSPEVWHIIFQTQDGQSCRATATTDQIHRLAETGNLGIDTQVATHEDGPYLPLVKVPEFQGCVVDVAANRDVVRNRTTQPFLARVLGRLGFSRKLIGRRSNHLSANHSGSRARALGGPVVKYAAAVAGAVLLYDLIDKFIQ